MRIESAIADEAVLRLTRRELTILCNALDFVCNAIDLPEFQTLIGAEPESADVLLGEVALALDRLRDNSASEDSQPIPPRDDSAEDEP
ncbi:MAG: hypothetical protein KIT00_04500 [Rhodospirillales bacterium]|nr:hypothetical protein [Rhodospirillales bacterium]